MKAVYVISLIVMVYMSGVRSCGTDELQKLQTCSTTLVRTIKGAQPPCDVLRVYVECVNPVLHKCGSSDDKDMVNKALDTFNNKFDCKPPITLTSSGVFASVFTVVAAVIFAKQFY